MSMYFSRNVVIPLWFAIFALGAFFAPPLNMVFSLFMLIMGLAVPTIALMVWHDPQRQPVGIGPRSLDTGPQDAKGVR